MSKPLLRLLLFLALISAKILASTTKKKPLKFDYCSLCGDAAATKHKCCNPDQRCDLLDAKNVPKFRKKMLEDHNAIRSQVAQGIFTGPAVIRGFNATKMNALSYNFELEYFAMCIARECNRKIRYYGGDLECMKTQNFKKVGRNVHVYPRNTFYVNATIYEDAVAQWKSEAKFLPLPGLIQVLPDVIANYSPSANFAPQHYESFALMIWDSLTDLGCAQASSNRTKQTYTICTYGGVNGSSDFAVDGAQVFDKSDTLCSKCPKGKCGSVPGLCGEPILVLDYPVKTPPRPRVPPARNVSDYSEKDYAEGDDLEFEDRNCTDAAVERVLSKSASLGTAIAVLIIDKLIFLK